jgi:hypothetical protein
MSTAAHMPDAGSGQAPGLMPLSYESIDVNVVTGDPALTSTEAGRELVELLAAHAVDAGRWWRLVDAVPASQASAMARTARQYAQSWTAFAEALEERPARR